MLINLSNHPSEKWSREQTNASISEYSHTEDIAFPAINPASNSFEIHKLAEEYLYKCLNLFEEYNIYNKQDTAENAVHIQGEFTFVYALVSMLKEKGIKCVASTSERKTIDLGDGKKELQFKFVQFREY